MNSRYTQQREPLFGIPQGLIVLLACLTIGALLLHGPIGQDSTYHEFADQRVLFFIPNFVNVVSNLPFLLVGIAGLLYLGKTQSAGPEKRTCYMLFFAGLFLTGLSSACYHLQPDNWSLFWDRLTMSLCFMALLTIIIRESISYSLGRQSLIPLVLFGLFSVLYWIVSEQYGAGDLRFYIATQYLTLLLIPVIILSWNPAAITFHDIVIMGSGYGLAKLFEHLDDQTFQLIWISGHSIKHLLSGFSAYWVLRILSRNYPVSIQANQGGCHDSPDIRQN